MMNEIKYRGKSISTGKWFYGRPVKIRILTNDEECFTIWGDAIQHYVDENGSHYSYMDEQVIPETISSYTGFKNSEGVEIYVNSEVEFENERFRVEWIQDIGRLVIAHYVDEDLYNEVLLIDEIADECRVIED